MKRLFLIIVLILVFKIIEAQPVYISNHFRINKFYDKDLNELDCNFLSDYKLQSFPIDSFSDYSKIVYKKDYTYSTFGHHYHNSLLNPWFGISFSTEYAYYIPWNQRLIFSNQRDTMIVDLLIFPFISIEIDSFVFMPGYYNYNPFPEFYSNITPYSLKTDTNFIFIDSNNYSKLTQTNFNQLYISNLSYLDKNSKHDSLKFEYFFIEWSDCNKIFEFSIAKIPYLKNNKKFEPETGISLSAFCERYRLLVTDKTDTMLIDLVDLDFSEPIYIDTIFFNSGYCCCNNPKGHITIGKDNNIKELDNYYLYIQHIPMSIDKIFSAEGNYLDDISIKNYNLSTTDYLSCIDCDSNNISNYFPVSIRNKYENRGCSKLLSKQFNNQRVVLVNETDTMVIDLFNIDSLYQLSIDTIILSEGYYAIDFDKYKKEGLNNYISIKPDLKAENKSYFFYKELNNYSQLFRKCDY